MSARRTLRGDDARELANRTVAEQASAKIVPPASLVPEVGESGHERPGQIAAEPTDAGEPEGDRAAGPVGRLRAAAAGWRQRAQAGSSDLDEGLPAGWPVSRSAPAPATAAAAPDAQVPRLLRQAAAWSWRLLLVGIIIYFAFRMADALRLVVLPFIAALLLTALLQPLTARLRRAGMPSLAATWCTILATIVVLTGLGMLAANRVGADYPALRAEVKHTVKEVQAYLARPPFHLNSARLQQYTNQVGNFLLQHKTDVAGTVLTGGKFVLELAAGLILMIFITFFLLKDGRRIWSFLVSGLRPDARRRADNAGDAAWMALVNYVRGTTAVAAIHAVFIGVALWLIGVPLLVPLVILVFLAAYVPLIGILVVGALAIVVTLATKGWVAAVILLVVFLLENQIESHLLQPLVVGRLVRLHPLGIILVLAVGGIIAGIPGAIVAVPVAAVIFYAWPYLRVPREPEPPGGGTVGSPP
jgi:predicted PurR-regulated permease PerM